VSARQSVERVFARFVRVARARSRATGGSGLGLATVKHLARDHGGEVTAWSLPGQGSTFTLRLPEMGRTGTITAGARRAAADDAAQDLAPAPTTATDHRSGKAH